MGNGELPEAWDLGARGNGVLPSRVLPRVAFAAFGRPTFDLHLAESVLTDSRRALESLPIEVVSRSDLLTSVDQAEAFGRSLASVQLDAVICQFTTFVDARFVAAVCSGGDWPVVLWSLREPSAVGERLLLNSLTGANMAGQQLRRMGRMCSFVLGNPTEAAFGPRLMPTLRAAAVRRALRGLSVAVFGKTPDGFTFSEPDPANMARIGVNLHYIDLEQVFAEASALDDGAVAAAVDGLRRDVRGVEHVASEQLRRAAALETVVMRHVEATGAQATCVRCWPEFFTTYGAAACSFVSALNERGIASACEADVLGSVTMDVLSRFAEGPAYLGDLVEVREEDDLVVFWHCGAGAFSLASPETGAQAGVHPNRQVGLTMEFALRPGPVTIARFGECADGLRLLVSGGEVLARPQRFLGTAATVRLNAPGSALDKVREWIEGGWEPHYALVYGDVRAELRELGRMLGIVVAQ